MDLTRGAITHLLILVLVLGACMAFGQPAAAFECSDFPAGDRINAAATGHQTDLGLARGSGSTLHAVWADRQDPMFPTVVYSRSEDRGATFGSAIPVAPAGALRVAGFPVVAVGPGEEVQVVWAGESKDDDLDICLARSLDGGKTFLPPITVNDRDLGDESLPAIAVTPGGITFVGWIEHPLADAANVRIARALPGQPFGPSVQVNVGAIATSCECCTIDIAIQGEDQVAVAFMGNLNYIRDLYVSRSTDGGQSFAEPVQLNDGHWFEAACPTSGPKLRVGPDQALHAVWLDRHDFAPDAGIYYARSTDGGATFSSPLPINEPGSAVTGHPSFDFTSDGAMHVVWERYNTATAALNLDYATSIDGGDSFTDPCSLGRETGVFQWLPSVLAWPDGELVIGWHDDRKGDSDIYLASVGVTTAVPATAPPSTAVRLWASPNPFAGTLRIGVDAVRNETPGMLAITDVQGRRVRLLALDRPELLWDGRDQAGQSVPAGSYFLQAPAGPPLKVVRLP